MSVRPHRPWPAGRLERVPFDSQVLAANPWGDATRRDLTVYLPPGYHGGGPYPAIWYLAAFTNCGAAVGNWRGFTENLGERLDRLIGEGKMGPCVVLAPDCFSSLGGTQYVDSAMVADHASYIHEELIPFAADQFHLLPGRDHRAVVGKSSGGYGALWFGMEYPNHWAAVACQSGDAHFDAVYRPDFGKAATVLRRFDGNIEAFLREFWTANAPSGDFFHTLMLICMAASYDPRSDGRIRLPFSLDTLELDADAWQRWLRFDPVMRLDECSQALKSLQAIFIDCGDADQYNIQFGSRILARKLAAMGAPVEYQEFAGTHSNIDHRLDVSLPFLYQVIK